MKDNCYKKMMRVSLRKFKQDQKLSKKRDISQTRRKPTLDSTRWFDPPNRTDDTGVSGCRWKT